MDESLSLEDKIKTHLKDVSSDCYLLGTPRLLKSVWTITGKIEAIDPSGIYWETFDVLITIPPDYPKVPPTLFETNEALERDPDNHVNGDGGCCMGTTTGIIRKLNYNITLKRWLDNVVMPFLLDQVHKKRKKKFVGKQHDHFEIGLLNDYREWWGFASNDDVIIRLSRITKDLKTKRNDPCFCGSGQKYKKCCNHSNEFLGIPNSVYEKDLDMIQRTSQE